MSKYIIKNCPNCLTYNRPKAICGLTYETGGFKGETTSYKHCQDCTGCVLKCIKSKLDYLKCYINNDVLVNVSKINEIIDSTVQLLDIQEVE